MKSPPPSDDALLAAYAAGDLAAATPLAQRHAPRVLAVALRMLNDNAEAEDVTQEAMMRLWRIAPDWQPGRAQVSTWLYRVAANLCTDRLRRRARLVPITDVDEPADPAPPAHEQLQQAQRRDALGAALMDLPARQRLAVVLRHIEELANPQIAQTMDISVDAVESLTARGRAALARALADRKEALGYE
ncbi:RNA polymerase sigma factor [Roseovarius sp. Pro17]|uniref:RNA polymerase sigma factor n=1 Tax=Roseovarius sp. Pro17 TaxID=3108175 RepID=UPI002D773480|nr:RNA polymerase sigma factor [Roseovarius sp. Pro17]